jgi:2-dehydro-3-deoxyphosphooctonate aldolase (KDO 8-P synthase)
METHPDPEQALSDGPNAWPLGKMKQLLETLLSIDASIKQHGYQEAEFGLGVPPSE